MTAKRPRIRANLCIPFRLGVFVKILDRQAAPPNQPVLHDIVELGYPALLDSSRGNAVGALVFAKGAVAGDIWLPSGGRATLDRAEIIGRRRTVLRPAPVAGAAGADPRYDRQTWLLGDAGQAILGGARVAIIGLAASARSSPNIWRTLGSGPSC